MIHPPKVVGTCQSKDKVIIFCFTEMLMEGGHPFSNYAKGRGEVVSKLVIKRNRKEGGLAIA